MERPNAKLIPTDPKVSKFLRRNRDPASTWHLDATGYSRYLFIMKSPNTQEHTENCLQAMLLQSSLKTEFSGL
jgi:hypothetical protein